MLLNIGITGARDDYKLVQSEEQNITISCVPVPNHDTAICDLHPQERRTERDGEDGSDRKFSQVSSSTNCNTLNLVTRKKKEWLRLEVLGGGRVKGNTKFYFMQKKKLLILNKYHVGMNQV